MRHGVAHRLYGIIRSLSCLLLLNSSYALALGEITISGGGTATLDNITTSDTVSLGSGIDTINTDGTQDTISGTISGSGDLAESGGGTLILSGTNTYTGGTTIEGSSTLEIESSANMGSASSTVTLNAGTLETTSGVTLSENISLGTNGADTINTDSVTDTLSGVISGSGGLVETGGGTLILTGTNTYTGGTTVEGGATLEIGSASNLGSVSSTVTLNGGTLETTAGVALSENVSLGASSGTINTDGVTDTISGAISGSGGLTETGGGTLVLSGTNTYTGGTTIEGGATLEIGSASNLGSASASLTLDNGTLVTTSSVTLSENISLGTGGGTINTDGVHDTFTGVISGSGELVEMGGSTLTLSGSNTYTGPTVVESGTLQAGVATDAFGNESAVTLNNTSGVTLDLNNLNETIGSLAGGGTSGGNVTLENGNLTVGGDNLSTDFAGTISGSGELIKTGSGTLDLSGSNTYTGGTVIAEGTLELGVDNALNGTGNVVVDSSATLNDNNHNETVAALTNNGTTDLGSGILSVSSYAGSGGALSVNAHSFGKLNATGNANLSSTALAVNFGNSFIPTLGQSFTVVSAGSVTGQFTSVGQTAALSVTPSYTGTSVSLSIGEIPYHNTATDPNQTKIATVLDQVRDSATGDLATVTGTLNVLNSAQLSAAFDQMGPSSLQALTQLGTVSENAQFSSLVHRFDAIGSGASNFASGHFQYYDAHAQTTSPVEAVLAASGSDLAGLGTSNAATGNPWGYFASGVGSFGTLDATSNAAGQTPGYTFNTAGTSFGADYRLNDELTLGGAGGYIQSHALSDLNDSTVDDESIKFGVYGVEHKDNWLADGYVGGAEDLYTTDRNVVFGDISRSAGASPKGEEFNTRWGLAYDHKMSWATLRPTLAVEYDRVMVHAFDESGAGALDLNVGSQTNESLRTELGGRITREYKSGNRIWVPYVGAAWQHEYLNQGGAINAQLASGGSAFAAQTADAGRNTALLGAGTVLQWNRSASLFFNYIGEVGRTNFMAHNFDGGIRCRF